MIITYHGLEHFRVQFGDTTLAFNPIGKDSQHKGANFGADVVLVSLNNEDMHGVENASRGDKKPFVISGPGEYEVRGVYVQGFSSKSFYGGGEHINTVYLVSLEDMQICFLGALGDASLSAEMKEAIDEIDILFVPIGGDGVLNALEAHKLCVSLEPKLIVPMHYGSTGDKDALKTFLKEEGETNGAPIEKLTIKRKDLEGKEGSIVVLESLV